jgi:hypothetical protein
MALLAMVALLMTPLHGLLLYGVQAGVINLHGDPSVDKALL